MNLFPWKKQSRSHYFKRSAKLLLCEKMEASAAKPITAVGGAPWWPTGVNRPKCAEGHLMGFIAQYLLSDVPGLEQDKGKLLSFHYCHQCMYDGKMSFGWRANQKDDLDQPKGYDVSIVEFDGKENDGEGVVADDVIGAHSITFDDYEELIAYTEAELNSDKQSASRINEQIASGVAQEISFEEATGFRSPEEVAPLAQRSESGVVYITHTTDIDEGNQTKIGGWPNWDQDTAWSVPATENNMIFVGQIDFVLGSRTAWGGGGKAFLFVNSAGSSPRRGIFVLQNT